MSELAHLRRRQMLEMLRRGRKLLVRNLQKEFPVTGMTIRRDLKVLEKQGMLKCVHGGAVLPESRTNDLLFSTREVLNADMKKAIGIKAAGLIRQGLIIFIDGSTTGVTFAKCIKSITNLCVVTDSLSVFFELQRTAGIQTILLGGMLQQDENTLGGSIAIENASKMYFNYVFFSAAGFDAEGIYNLFPTGVEVKRAVIERSENAVLLADSTKCGRMGSWKLCGWDKVKMFISDDRLSADTREMLGFKGVEVIS